MPAKDVVKSRDRNFRLLFDEHPQPMWVFDSATGRIKAANSAICALYGYSAKEFTSMALTDLLPANELRPAEASGIGPSAWRHAVKSGGLIDVEITVQNISLNRQRLQLATVRDITAKRHLEEQLRQSQKMEAVGMLAGGVAHDFNNLLTIITGYSQLLLNHTPASDPNRQPMEQILKAGERAAELTNQLLAFSRRQTPKPKVIDLNTVVSSLSVMLRRVIGEDVELSLTLEPGIGRVRADPGQIEQVLMNLVVNARDAMPAGGAIEVSTHQVTMGKPAADAQKPLRPGPYVVLEVSDTGVGMDDATAARLFEPFFTTKPEGKGVGLGLSTVLSIVTRAGGAVDVQSEPGRGAIVRVFLPRVDLPLAVEPEQARAAKGGAETILLVEDDPTVRELVRETLNRSGYRVLDAADSMEARRIASAHTGSLDLLITDVVLPRVSGKQLAAALSARFPAMKVLLISGYSHAALGDNGGNGDILQEETPFLQKPFTPSAIVARVREILDGSGRTKSAGS